MLDIYLLCLMLNGEPRHCGLVQEIMVTKKYGYEIPHEACTAGEVYFRRPRDPMSGDAGDFYICQGNQSPYLPSWVKFILEKK